MPLPPDFLADNLAVFCKALGSCVNLRTGRADLSQEEGLKLTLWYVTGVVDYHVKYNNLARLQIPFRKTASRANAGRAKAIADSKLHW